MTKIKILDFETVTSGDLSYDRFKKYGDVEVFDLTSRENLISRIGDADVVLCNKTPMTKEVFEACKNIKYIGLFATGYNNVDLKAAKNHGITVSNAPKYSTKSVAQHTFSLILYFFSKVSQYNSLVHDGEWERSRTFSYFNIPVNGLAGKTISIIGYGAIGREVAKIANAFDMNINVSGRHRPNDLKYNFVSRDEAFKTGDIVTIHCPLNEDSFHMVNKHTLSLMKPSAVLINTARGDIVKEDDLADALNMSKIAGAGLDVLSVEPMQEDTPLKYAKNCCITPHIGWAPVETREALLAIVEENLSAFLNGSPINVVN